MGQPNPWAELLPFSHFLWNVVQKSQKTLFFHIFCEISKQPQLIEHASVYEMLVIQVAPCDKLIPSYSYKLHIIFL